MTQCDITMPLLGLSVAQKERSYDSVWHNKAVIMAQCDLKRPLLWLCVTLKTNKKLSYDSVWPKQDVLMTQCDLKRTLSRRSVTSKDVRLRPPLPPLSLFLYYPPPPSPSSLHSTVFPSDRHRQMTLFDLVDPTPTPTPPLSLGRYESDSWWKSTALTQAPPAVLINICCAAHEYTRGTAL